MYIFILVGRRSCDNTAVRSGTRTGTVETDWNEGDLDDPDRFGLVVSSAGREFSSP